MAADDLLAVNLPPVPWTNGTTARRPREEGAFADSTDRKDRKLELVKREKNQSLLEASFEERPEHELDSFA